MYMDNFFRFFNEKQFLVKIVFKLFFNSFCFSYIYVEQTDYTRERKHISMYILYNYFI